MQRSGQRRCLILADSAERSEEIDVERAKAAMKRAEERLKKAEDIDFHRAELPLKGLSPEYSLPS